MRATTIAILLVPIGAHLGAVPGASYRRIATRSSSVRPTSGDSSPSDWLEDVSRGLGESIQAKEGFFQGEHTEPLDAHASELVQLAKYREVDTSDVEAGEAARARRKIRLGSGMSWLWEPQGSSDPGIEWESIGLVSDVKIFPTLHSHHEPTERRHGGDDLDTRAHGLKPHVTRVAGGRGTDERGSQRLTAMVRLK